jgi:hypothetical protein
MMANCTVRRSHDRTNRACHTRPILLSSAATGHHRRGWLDLDGTAGAENGIRLSAAVMTHPRRAHRAENLRNSAPDLDLRLVFDPRPDGPPTAVRTAQAAWAAAAPAATHHLVLQDDVRLPVGVARTVRAIVAARPRDAVALFCEWGSRTAHLVRLAALTGQAWAEVVDDYVPTQALVLPRRLIAGAVERLALADRSGEPDDLALQRYLVGSGCVPYVAVPNVVEHDDVASVVGNDRMGRRQAAFRADRWPAAGADPSGAVAGLAVVPHFSWWRGRSELCVRNPSRPGRWRKIDTAPALARRGVPADVLARAVEAAVRAAGGRPRVPAKLLRELALTAFTVGWWAADLAAESRGDLPAALHRPPARAAMRTLPGGALRRFVAPDELAPLGVELAPLADAAVLAGIATWGPAPLPVTARHPGD